MIEVVIDVSLGCWRCRYGWNDLHFSSKELAGTT
jgi:hypothetical protein